MIISVVRVHVVSSAGGISNPLVSVPSPSAAFPLFGIQMYNGLGYQWATSLLAFLTVAMLPFPFIFFYYGKKIRARSRYATP